MRAMLISPMVLLLALTTALPVLPLQARERFTPEQASHWQTQHGWLVGCNFIPSSAINQLEMWQAESFDPKTIDRELGWAESLGFNSVRVFLHDLLWEQDPKGLLQRMEQFLDIAAKHRIGVMFVPFDAVWDPHPALGKQREPKPGLHNSGWMQSPSAAILKDEQQWGRLEAYITGVIGHFKNDRRIQCWDLYNEPDNTNGNSYGQNGSRQELPDKPERVRRLLGKTFAWARSCDPVQPLTSGVWAGPDWGKDENLSPMQQRQINESDVISFHSYDPLPRLQERTASLKRFGRPLLCTEYMARPVKSTFDPHLKWMQENHVAAYNWGFVDGKSQTIYPWDSWQKPYAKEPPVWFHDIFRRDGTPYRREEVDFIRSVTGKR